MKLIREYSTIRRQLIEVEVGRTVLRKKVECDSYLGAEPQAAVQTRDNRQEAKATQHITALPSVIYLAASRQHFGGLYDSLCNIIPKVWGLNILASDEAGWKHFVLVASG
jgi:hypothetical protein